ncbi:MAG: SAM-dependent methyltransferase [Spirochaetota bacterium]
MGTSRHHDGSLLRGRRIDLEALRSLSGRPALYGGRDRDFWTDPYVSRHVLDAHLDPHTDDATRRPEHIAATVETILAHLGRDPEGVRLLDLACGPGLYAEQFAARGVVVTGIDFSSVSIKHARKQAKQQGLEIEYREEDLTEARLGGPYDVVTLIYGEFCTFSERERRDLLNRIRESLAPGGMLVLDVFTDAYVKRNRSQDEWYVSARDGFWQREPHLVLMQHFFYRSDSASVARYILVDDHGRYRDFNVWWRHFDQEAVRAFLESSGFTVEALYGNLWGGELEDDGEWIGVYARVT